MRKQESRRRVLSYLKHGQRHAVVRLTEGENEDYLHPATLSRWVYILPISPIPMMPIVAVSLVSTMIAAEAWLKPIARELQQLQYAERVGRNLVTCTDEVS
jgi:hypothetical protein